METREEIKADGGNKPEGVQAVAVLVVLELTKLLLTKGLMAEWGKVIQFLARPRITLAEVEVGRTLAAEVLRIELEDRLAMIVRVLVVDPQIL